MCHQYSTVVNVETPHPHLKHHHHHSLPSHPHCAASLMWPCSKSSSKQSLTSGAARASIMTAQYKRSVCIHGRDNRPFFRWGCPTRCARQALGDGEGKCEEGSLRFRRGNPPGLLNISRQSVQVGWLAQCYWVRLFTPYSTYWASVSTTTSISSPHTSIIFSFIPVYFWR